MRALVALKTGSETQELKDNGKSEKTNYRVIQVNVCLELGSCN